jgi:hypothetical protein
MINKKIEKKITLVEFYKKAIAELDEKKIYIIHVKMNLKGLRAIINPYTFLIQAAAHLNGEYKINHTALIYGIYKDKILGKSAHFVEANLFGLKRGNFWNLVDTIHSNNGEIWLEEVNFINLDSTHRKWLIHFVEKRILGGKYNILKAIGSQTFKSKFFIPLNFIFNLIGKASMKMEGYYCTQLVKTIIDELIVKTMDQKKKLKTKKAKAKKFSSEKAHTIYPSEFFGKFGVPKRFI